MTSPHATSRPVLFDWFFAISIAAVAATVVRILNFTPYEANQGAVQKVYYIHISSAMGAYVALGIVAVMSVVYLWLRDKRADLLAESAAEVGLLFTTVVLVTGPIWAKPIWGTWWSGDMRLNLTLFLWFLVASYLVLRGVVEDPMMRGRYSAVLGILAALDIPFIHMSVYMFRTMHPMPILLKPSTPSLPPEMLITLLMAIAAFTLFSVALIRARYRIASAEEASRA